MDLLKQNIYNLENISQIREELHTFDDKDVKAEDGKYLDLLHHSILAKNVEVVRLLLLHNYFDVSHKPSTFPYLGLACWKGHRSVIEVLLIMRPDEGKQKSDLSAYERLEEESLNLSFASCSKINIVPESNCQQLLPVELAAIRGHVNCIESVFLYDPVFRNSQKDCCLLEKAVHLTSVLVLKYLLDFSKPSQRDIDTAFKVALRKKDSTMLDLLLCKKPNITSVLNGMNAFHVLYMYSMSQGGHISPLGLGSCTKVLLKHGLDVNSMRPLGSFPLYNILYTLTQELDSDTYFYPDEHVNCVRYLLEAGAAIDIDECALHHKAQKEEDDILVSLTVYGRDLFTSAFNALFVSLQSVDSWNSRTDECVSKVCQLLLERDADMTQLDSFGETPLHDLMKVLAMQHCMHNYHCTLLATTLCLLCYGADPNISSANGILPVVHYFLILFNLLPISTICDFNLEQFQACDSLRQVLRLLYFMRATNVKIAVIQIYESTRIMQQREVLSEDMAALVKSEINVMISTPKMLGDLCALLIWEVLDRDRKKLTKCGLPCRLVNQIENLFK